MRVLCACTGFVHSGCFGAVGIPVLAGNKSQRLILRVYRYSLRVGTHVGDKTLCTTVLGTDIDTLVKLLRHTHDTRGLEIELAGCLLLKGGGGKGRHGRFLALGTLDGADGKGLTLDGGKNDFYLFLIADLGLLTALAVKSYGERLALATGDQGSIDRPVFLGYKCADLFLAVNDDTGRRRLHTPCRKSASDILPKEGRQLIAHNTVEDSARLLCIDKIHVYAARLLDGCLDYTGCDLVKADTQRLFHGNLKRRCQMPCDGFSLSVRVGCQKYFLCRLGFLADLLDQIALAANIYIMRCKIILDIHPQGALGKIPHMSLGSNNLIICTEVFLDRSNFGW